MTGRLANKVCIITGAASGQGRAGTEAFAREGALLVLSDVDREGLKQVAGIVSDADSEPILHHGDLTTEDANAELVDLARSRHGRVDALYNSAGLVRFSKLHETTLEDWNFVIAHELTMTFLACKYAIRSMLESGGGSIINMSSSSGLFSSAPGHAAHAATKAGVVGLTRQVAMEYGPQGIRCNALAPSKLQYAPGQRRIEELQPLRPPTGIPLGRHARPEDTALCAVYLASHESSYTTGQVFVIDGGHSAA